MTFGKAPHVRLLRGGAEPAAGPAASPVRRHDGLAGDLQEELRHLVKALVWLLIRRVH